MLAEGSLLALMLHTGCVLDSAEAVSMSISVLQEGSNRCFGMLQCKCNMFHPLPCGLHTAVMFTSCLLCSIGF